MSLLALALGEIKLPSGFALRRGQACDEVECALKDLNTPVADLPGDLPLSVYSVQDALGRRFNGRR